MQKSPRKRRTAWFAAAAVALVALWLVLFLLDRPPSGLVGETADSSSNNDQKASPPPQANPTRPVSVESLNTVGQPRATGTLEPSSEDDVHLRELLKALRRAYEEEEGFDEFNRLSGEIRNYTPRNSAMILEAFVEVVHDRLRRSFPKPILETALWGHLRAHSDEEAPELLAARVEKRVEAWRQLVDRLAFDETPKIAPEKRSGPFFDIDAYTLVEVVLSVELGKNQEHLQRWSPAITAALSSNDLRLSDLQILLIGWLDKRGLGNFESEVHSLYASTESQSLAEASLGYMVKYGGQSRRMELLSQAAAIWNSKSQPAPGANARRASKIVAALAETAATPVEALATSVAFFASHDRGTGNSDVANEAAAAFRRRGDAQESRSELFRMLMAESSLNVIAGIVGVVADAYQDTDDEEVLEGLRHLLFREYDDHALTPFDKRFAKTRIYSAWAVVAKYENVERVLAMAKSVVESRHPELTNAGRYAMVHTLPHLARVGYLASEDVMRRAVEILVYWGDAQILGTEELVSSSTTTTDRMVIWDGFTRESDLAAIARVLRKDAANEQINEYHAQVLQRIAKNIESQAK